jgi:hypothetical protein
VTYLIGPKVYLQLGSWVGLIVLIVLLVMAGKEERAKMGGYITFQEILKPMFLAYIIISFVSTLVQLLMFKLVDPGLADITREMSIEGLQKMKGILGEEGYETAMEATEKQDFSGSIKQSILGFAFNIIIGFGICALIARIMRRNPPVDDQYTKDTDTI